MKISTTKKIHCILYPLLISSLLVSHYNGVAGARGVGAASGAEMSEEQGEIIPRRLKKDKSMKPKKNKKKKKKDDKEDVSVA